jgi:transcriptional regulator of heat shock response
VNVTERQQRILKAIVTEYMGDGKPVGSANLVKKFDLPASSATVRYEMARLSHEGLIAKMHHSSGRVPTIMGLRYYLDTLFDEKVVDYMLEVEVKKRLSCVKYDRELLLREAVSILAEKAKHLGFCVMEDGPRVGGITNLLVLDKKTLTTVFAMLESESAKYKVLLGSEIGLSGLNSCALVYQQVKMYGEVGWFGVLGPLWMDYRVIVPLLTLVTQAAEAEASHWGKKGRD